MARMAIDDMFVRDPRIVKVARAIKASTGTDLTKHDVMGRLLCVYAVVYDRVSDVLSADDVDIAAEFEGFSEAMIAGGLAARDRRGVLIRGADKRLEYLRTRSESGREGGRKSGETRRNRAKQESKVTFEANEAPPNLPDPVPDPVPPPVPDPVPDQEKSAPALPASGRLVKSRRKPKSDVTEAERASAMRVLGKLGDRNGIRYSGSDAHVALIAEQLRTGVTELELRAVVAYCADKWSEKPDMVEYLRPETLFGPKTISKYLDPARTAYARELGEAARRQPQSQPQQQAPQPQLALVPGGAS